MDKPGDGSYYGAMARALVCFRQVGLPKESALAFSIVAAALAVLLSLSGLFVWLARGSHAHAATGAAGS